MSEPEVSTEVESEVGPYQFTILSLMILTAAVAGFFALLTQAPFIITVCYVLLASVIVIYPKNWRGIFAYAILLMLFLALATQSPLVFTVAVWFAILHVPILALVLYTLIVN